MSKTEVAQITSRGSVHKYIQELKLQNFGWDTIKVKLRGRFSDCTSTAAAQNKLSLLKQDGNSMHEYITHFSDLLGMHTMQKPQMWAQISLQTNLLKALMKQTNIPKTI